MEIYVIRYLWQPMIEYPDSMNLDDESIENVIWK